MHDKPGLFILTIGAFGVPAVLCGVFRGGLIKPVTQVSRPGAFRTAEVVRDRRGGVNPNESTCMGANNRARARSLQARLGVRDGGWEIASTSSIAS